MATKINILWLRRDLRLDDNAALYHALKEDGVIMPIFIFDEDILEELPKDDARVSFLYDELVKMNGQLATYQSGISIYHGRVDEIFEEILSQFNVRGLFYNEDYEPYALQRDKGIEKKFQDRGLFARSFKDQVIFAKDDVVKDDGTPYTVYTPYMKKWRAKFERADFNVYDIKLHSEKLLKTSVTRFPDLSDLGFKKSSIKVLPFDISKERIEGYSEERNFPAKSATSMIGPHLRFGTVGIRQVINELLSRGGDGGTYLNELIWREFFMQILFHFPESQTSCFKKKYEFVTWRNDLQEYEKWCKGETGYLMVDAGMNELNRTGYMHNRVRMVVASFLCKHLLIDWRWGEAYFSKKLLDYECASNVGNWQWAAGSGCDAAPYFRVFNPHTQLMKFDPNKKYVEKWLGETEMRSFKFPEIVEHKFARNRALEAYKLALSGK